MPPCLEAGRQAVHHDPKWGMSPTSMVWGGVVGVGPASPPADLHVADPRKARRAGDATRLSCRLSENGCGEHGSDQRGEQIDQAEGRVESGQVVISTND